MTGKQYLRVKPKRRRGKARNHARRPKIRKPLRQSRQQIFETVKRHMAHLDHPGGCLYWAAETVRVLRDCQYDAQLQAGSASWEIVPPHLDDGIAPDRFAYEYQGAGSNAARAVAHVALGELPEMHCWAAIIDAEQIVDFSLHLQPTMCRRTTGLAWRGERPDYFWGDADSCRDLRHAYQPDVEAIDLAYRVLQINPARY